MKKRSKLPHIVSKFYIEIFVQFNRCIKILHSNNALEYTQLVINSVCDNRGLIHQTSCAHTSQQNRVAEQTHRYLLDVTCTLLFTTQVPKHFLGVVVLTTWNFITHIPSYCFQS